MTTATPKKSITEKDKAILAAWQKVRPKTPEDLAYFVKALLTDFHHDYGTIVHACAAAAMAGFRTVDADPDQGGITGFQASALLWILARELHQVDGPARLVNYSKMLYPQYEDQFVRDTITPDTWKWLQAEAKKLMAEPDAPAEGRAFEHWLSIVNGKVPFGYTVADE